MNIEVGEKGVVELSQVFNPVVIKTDSGYRLAACQRDGGIELRLTLPDGAMQLHVIDDTGIHAAGGTLPGTARDRFDYCPVCGLSYFTQALLSPYRESSCSNGHHWYRCPVHGRVIEGGLPDKQRIPDDCVCTLEAIKKDIERTNVALEIAEMRFDEAKKAFLEAVAVKNLLIRERYEKETASARDLSEGVNQ